jgi:PAS domain S-box-containing protein
MVYMSSRRYVVKHLPPSVETVFAALRDAVVVTDRDTSEIVFWNAAAESLLGYPASAVLGRSVVQIIPPSRRDSPDPNAMLSAGAVQSSLDAINRPLKLPVVHFSGEERLIEMTLSPIALETAFVVAVMRDVSAAEQLEYQLAQNQMVAEHASDLIDLTAPDGTVLYASPSWGRLLKMPPEAMIGDSALKVIHADDRPLAIGTHRAALSGERPELVEYRICRPDNSVLWVEVSKHAVVDPQTGAITAIQSISRDITDRRAAQEALVENERFLKDLLANLPGMVYRYHPGSPWTLAFASPGALALTGYPPEDLLFEYEVSYADLITPEDLVRIRAEYCRALARREPYQLDYRLTSRDGVLKRVWEQGRGVFDAEGELVALEGYRFDMSDRYRIEAELE